VITKPFFYEGKIRYMNAEEGIKELKKHVDTLIVIPNDKISLVVEKGTPLLKSFSVANDVLKQAVQGISDIILIPGLINVDFADVKTIIEDKGRGVMGSGVGKGDTGALEAAKKAIANPLLEESSIEGSKGILVNITGGLELSLNDVQEAISFIYDSAHDDVHLIFGAVIDGDVEEEVRVTVIATGFNDQKEKIELPKIERWSPLRHSTMSYRGSERVLSKNIQPGSSTEVNTTEIMTYENPIDVPAFLRKTTQPPQQGIKFPSHEGLPPPEAPPPHLFRGPCFLWKRVLSSTVTRDRRIRFLLDPRERHGIRHGELSPSVLWGQLIFQAT
jgi:cell division protein FtsZ